MLFFLIYATVSETGVSSGVSRTLVWLGFKFLAFVTTKIWAKIAYFGMGDDIQAMLLVFMMVIMLYYPKTLPASFAFAVSMHTHTCHCWQVMTLQFLTELVFMKIEPFKLEFFMMLLLKAALHISIKGGLLLKMHHKLSHW